jgi:hypothetical protein
MDNYVYIVAGLPELTSGFESTGFEYAALKESIMELLSERDQQLVALLEEGFDEDALGAEFYTKAAASNNHFIREYFDFDGRLRNMKVNYLAKRLGKKGEDYVVELPEADFEEGKQIEEILADADFVQREQKMDELKWEKASDIARMDYFNMNAILAFMVKAKTVQRWAELDAAKGEEMFRKLVKEVRGTFEGVNVSSTISGNSAPEKVEEGT